jgi:hypothetical protein
MWLSLLLAAACASSTAGVKPISSPDPGTPCFGGRVAWNLQISDQRGDRPDAPQLIALIRDSLSRSLPACKWTDAAQADTGTITIEVHRFRTTSDGAVWDAFAEWGVWVRDARGGTLTDFEATGEASRPSYRGENSERVALQHALEQAMAKTLAGLRVLSTTG